jgi:hypothetical protein
MLMRALSFLTDIHIFVSKRALIDGRTDPPLEQHPTGMQSCRELSALHCLILVILINLEPPSWRFA